MNELGQAAVSADKAPRTERGRRTVRKLLEAAAQEFGERGYHEAAITGMRTMDPALIEGAILAVTDREILAAYRRVAREGLFAEPASAASVAGLLHLHAEGMGDGGHQVAERTSAVGGLAELRRAHPRVSEDRDAANDSRPSTASVPSAAAETRNEKSSEDRVPV